MDYNGTMLQTTYSFWHSMAVHGSPHCFWPFTLSHRLCILRSARDFRWAHLPLALSLAAPRSARPARECFSRCRKDPEKSESYDVLRYDFTIFYIATVDM